MPVPAVRALLDLLFPPLCHVCREFIPDAGDLEICSRCMEKIPKLVSPLCPVCGAPFATEDDGDHLCGPCLLHHPPFLAARSATLYSGPVQGLIHRLKYGKKVHLARPLGLLAAGCLASFVEEKAPDLIVPVPLHRKRLRQRGFNQSQLIAAVLGKAWGVPLVVGNLRRVRWTEPQTGLAAAERGGNVRDAFAVRNAEGVRGKRVLLVDDVFTTGSTVRACAEPLQEAGVADLLVVTVARGMPP